MTGSVARLLNALAGPPRPVQSVTSFTVPVAIQEDGDEDAAREWLDESAERAGEMYAAQRLPGGGLR